MQAHLLEKKKTSASGKHRPVGLHAHLSILFLVSRDQSGSDVPLAKRISVQFEAAGLISSLADAIVLGLQLQFWRRAAWP